MGAPKRVRIDPTDDWEQLRLRVQFPEQETYELLRPIVLFGQTAAERAQATGVAERTLDRKADRFDAEGMAGLFPTTARADDDRRRLPADLRHRILALKAEYPAFRPHEIAAICRRRDDCRVSHKTVDRILTEEPLPPLPKRRYPPYAQIADGARRRLAIVHLSFEGWNVASIAGYLETTRTRVYETLHRFFAEDFAGLPDKPHAPRQPARKADFRAMAAIRRLQANPELGEFRVHAVLRQLGIHLSPRTCGRIMALNRTLYGLPKPEPTPREPKPMPFAAQRRPQYWSADIRYIDHGLGDFKVYAVTILDNYSRAIVASGLSRTQDLGTFLMVLFAAVQQHGAPEGLVTDGGSIFRAKHLRTVLDQLGVTKHEIARRQPWQNYIEANFGVQRRLADWDFARAGNWPELLAVHDHWVTEHNFQDYWAHRECPDDRRSPAAVLYRVCGRLFSPDDLHRIFYSTRFGRVLDRAGYARFRRWRVYAERGLGGESVAVWLYAEHLTLVYRDEPLAQYRVAYQPDRRRLKTVTPAQLLDTAHRSPQPPLWTWDDADWLPVLRLPDYAPRRLPPGDALQPPLFVLDEASA